jgi:hypothetical protein
MALQTRELDLPSGSLFHPWAPRRTIVLGGPMIGMYPHVAEFVERFH